MDEPKEIEDWIRISILGSGAFGVVTLWKNKTTEDYIAIKKCKFQLVSNITAKQRSRWEKEVEQMRKINHINIIAFKPLPKALKDGLDHFNPTKLPLLSMEYCTKGNLRRVLSQVQNSCGLSELEVRTVLEDITRAVMHLHSLKITHRDIKPDNIVLQDCNGRRGGIIYKLIDLGYAKELNDTVVSFVGTLHYLAPEIMRMQNYNRSVDYWSFGVMTFEIICGFLPFLPQKTPFERFGYIEKKSPEHICIQQLQSGCVTNSSEIIKPNHITTCLKSNLEIWLRHVLQYDPDMRTAKFPDGTNVFEKILNILKKPIVKVFSVFTLEFYSYEIIESTLLSTLKDWIARDTKVDSNHQILLTDGEFGLISDDKSVLDLLGQDVIIYVFNKGSFTNRAFFNLPKYVKSLFDTSANATFLWKDLRLLYTKSLFFIRDETKLIEAVMDAVKLYYKHMKMTTLHLNKITSELYRNVSDLSVKSECYFNLRCVSMGRKVDFRKSLEIFKNLISQVEIAIKNTNFLIAKVDEFNRRQSVLNKLQPKIDDVIKTCEMYKSVDDALRLIVKMSSERLEQNTSEMKKILSAFLKQKDKFLNNSNFQNFTKAASVALKDNYDVIKIIKDSTKNIAELTKQLDDNEKAFYGLNSMEAPWNSNQIDTYELISENKDLRFKFEEAMNLVMLRQKKLDEESQKYLNVGK